MKAILVYRVYCLSGGKYGELEIPTRRVWGEVSPIYPDYESIEEALESLGAEGQGLILLPVIDTIAVAE